MRPKQPSLSRWQRWRHCAAVLREKPLSCDSRWGYSALSALPPAVLVPPHFFACHRVCCHLGGMCLRAPACTCSQLVAFEERKTLSEADWKARQQAVTAREAQAEEVQQQLQQHRSEAEAEAARCEASARDAMQRLRRWVVLHASPCCGSQLCRGALWTAPLRAWMALTTCLRTMCAVPKMTTSAAVSVLRSCARRCGKCSDCLPRL